METFIKTDFGILIFEVNNDDYSKIFQEKTVEARRATPAKNYMVRTISFDSTKQEFVKKLFEAVQVPSKSFSVKIHPKNFELFGRINDSKPSGWHCSLGYDIFSGGLICMNDVFELITDERYIVLMSDLPKLSTQYHSYDSRTGASKMKRNDILARVVTRNIIKPALAFVKEIADVLTDTPMSAPATVADLRDLHPTFVTVLAAIVAFCDGEIRILRYLRYGKDPEFYIALGLILQMVDSIRGYEDKAKMKLDRAIPLIESLEEFRLDFGDARKYKDDPEVNAFFASFAAV